MTILWTSADALAATGGKTTADWQASGVSIDTRSIETGDLFVALTDVRDGHDFVAQALANGAAAALVSRIPDDVPAGAPLLLVDDVLEALGAMAVFARARTTAKVVGVTGSVGKTSTKEMLRTVLTRQGQVFAAEKSFNNHWGVPLTLARMPADADFAVIEIGMNHPGEIAPLAKLARPHVAMITTVAAAHMQAFDGIQGIAAEKASIFQGLVPDGFAVINGDIETRAILIDAAKRAGAKYSTFGAGPQNTDRLLDVQLSQNTTVASASLDGLPAMFKIASLGQHFAMNGLGVLAVVRALGADTGLAANDLGLWQPPAGRGSHEIIGLDLAEHDQSVTLIDDAYNANPASLDAALNVLKASTPTDGLGRLEQGRRIAILGDMLELGDDELQQHAKFASHPAIEMIDVIHCCGPRMQALWQALPQHKRGEWVEKAAELATISHRLLDAGDVILVKGSLGSKVGVVVDAIRKLGHAGNNE
ncbi:MAG TPA: UDP-N-acetylmuramoyl-tripeptide--D-alanyl-D-alanine ligase [Rhodobacteraceae bacterium]|nr:UDP-N-acetylmuramoyl-tripeptide--D-alanyl-D-alanine ligase [Paracoccaceae bacterium]